MTSICLIAVLGTGLLCSGDSKPVAVSEFCRVAGPDIVRLKSLSAAEVAALTRPRKEAILGLRRTYTKLCAKSPKGTSP